MQSYCAIYFFLLLAVPLAHAFEQLDDNRQEKLISTFQIVRFPNDACIGSNARNGTCYTSAECSDKSGTSAGSCADGFGVCCTFVMTTCDQTTSENITYWTQPATIPTGTCGLTVCPVADNVCQLRLDFTTFVITGPSTMTASQVRRHYGQVTGDIGDAAFTLQGSNWATNCFLDHFSAQGASPSSSPPIICGTNTGFHMYVEADTDRCNRLNFHLAGAQDAVALTTATATVVNHRGLAALSDRTWDMTVTQLECGHPVLPPPGCTEYFFGSIVARSIRSYNYVGTTGSATFTAVHLANQHQRICIRRERGMCVGCFSATALIDFSVSGDSAIATHTTVPGGCCGYATMITGANANTLYATQLTVGVAAAISTQYGWDCIVIPGAFGIATNVGVYTAAPTAAILQNPLVISATIAPTPSGPQICGNGNGIGPGSTTSLLAAAFDDQITTVGTRAATASVCTRHYPFKLEFLSDDLEGQGGVTAQSEYSSAAQAAGQGFILKATQLACV